MWLELEVGVLVKVRSGAKKIRRWVGPRFRAQGVESPEESGSKNGLILIGKRSLAAEFQPLIHGKS
jgi:hypothetical protein